MIKIISNIKEFLKRYREKVAILKQVMDNLAQILAEKMSNDMKNLIQTDKRWQEHGNLSTIDTVDFRIEATSPQSVKVYVGENLPKFEMSDGTLVNPAFFIEFGFGILGQNKPKQNHEEYNWEYNIRGHKESWFFWYDGILMESKGREGINFIYTTMDNYRQNLVAYFRQLLGEQANGGI